MAFTRAQLDQATDVVRRHFAPTPAYAWPLLGQEVGGTVGGTVGGDAGGDAGGHAGGEAATEVWVKHENQTPTGAFKVRGGLVYADRARRERPQVRGFVSATRGNHGQSLAYAARAAGLRAVIVVPEGNSPDKNAAMEGFGAELIVHGSDYQEAREHAMSLGNELGLEAVPPFHPDLVVGVATYAKELFDTAGALDTVYVPVGMGSGICGLIGARDVLGLDTQIVGVVSDQAPATALSFQAREMVTTPTAATFVDGVACRTPVPEAVDAMVAGAARILTVSEEATAEAMRVLLRTTHQLPEPAGAIALAGLLAERERAAGRRVGVVLSGGNCDAPILAQVLAGQTPRP